MQRACEATGCLDQACPPLPRPARLRSRRSAQRPGSPRSTRWCMPRSAAGPLRRGPGWSLARKSAHTHAPPWLRRRGALSTVPIEGGCRSSTPGGQQNAPSPRSGAARQHRVARRAPHPPFRLVGHFVGLSNTQNGLRPRYRAAVARMCFSPAPGSVRLEIHKFGYECEVRPCFEQCEVPTRDFRDLRDFIEPASRPCAYMRGPDKASGLCFRATCKATCRAGRRAGRLRLLLAMRTCKLRVIVAREPATVEGCEGCLLRRL